MLNGVKSQGGTPADECFAPVSADKRGLHASSTGAISFSVPDGVPAIRSCQTAQHIKAIKHRIVPAQN